MGKHFSKANSIFPEMEVEHTSHKKFFSDTEGNKISFRHVCKVCET